MKKLLWKSGGRFAGLPPYGMAFDVPLDGPGGGRVKVWLT
jgi:hypothetical protein